MRRLSSAGDHSIRIWPSGALQEPVVSPVAGDCVVELVGLEPTTKVLWNMVGVRPTPLVGHPSRSPGGLLFSVIILAAGQTRTSNQILRKAVRVRPAHHVGHDRFRSRPTGVRRTSPFLHPLSLAAKFGFPEAENCGCGRRRWNTDRRASDVSPNRISVTRLAVPRRPQAGMRLKVRQVRGFGVVGPIRWADHTGARSPGRAADAPRSRT